jgi:uncharacterized protein (DUF2249 family)
MMQVIAAPLPGVYGGYSSTIHRLNRRKTMKQLEKELELDVTTIAPRERHPLIFKTFDALTKDESFVIRNDHDPKPLYYSFLHEREGLFGWEYLAEGPEVWRVRITRK